MIMINVLLRRRRRRRKSVNRLSRWKLIEIMVCGRIRIGTLIALIEKDGLWKNQDWSVDVRTVNCTDGRIDCINQRCVG